METQQLTDLIPSLEISMSSTYLGIEDRQGWKAHSYRITLHRGGATLETPFYCDLSWVTPPGIADVLYSLVLDAHAGEMTFEEYCSQFDENPDSRKAYATWQECAAMATRVREFLGPDFETVANAEH